MSVMRRSVPWSVAVFAGLLGMGCGASSYAQEADVVGHPVTGVRTQNLSATQSTTLRYELRTADGTVRAEVERERVPAGGAATLYLPLEEVVPPGAHGAFVASDRGTASIVRTDWIGAGGAAIYASATPGEEMWLPLFVVGYGGVDSQVTIQNTDPARSIEVVAELLATVSPAVVFTRSLRVAAGGTVTVDARDAPWRDVAPNTSQGFLGALRMRAERPIAVQSLMIVGAGHRVVSGFEGASLAEADETLFAPLIRRRFFGYDTGIAVTNPTTETARLHVRYMGNPAGGLSACTGEYLHGPLTLAGGASYVFYQGPGGGSGLPDGCVGSAVIQSSTRVLAVVNDTFDFTAQGAAYNAVSRARAGRRVALPLVRRQHGPWLMTTGIQVMNVGDAAAPITITFSGEHGEELTGCGRACTAFVGPMASHTFYLGAAGLNVLPAGAFGSAVVTADQDVVVIVHDASEVGVVDGAAYVGINADGEGIADDGAEGACMVLDAACHYLPLLYKGWR